MLFLYQDASQPGSEAMKTTTSSCNHPLTLQHSALCRNKSVSFISVETEPNSKLDAATAAAPDSDSFPILDQVDKAQLDNSMTSLVTKQNSLLLKNGQNGALATPRQQFFLDFKDKGSKNTFQGNVYNFLERPTGWKCFIYHFTV